MLHRAFSLTILLAITIFFYGCGGDNPSGPEPGSEPEPEQGVISGTVNASDGSGGIEDALLKLVENETVSQETFSNVGGEFSFANLESGQYEVTMTLPQGYRESGTTSKTIQVDNDASVEFEGEPIKEDTATVKAGEQDTVATGSGAFLAVNASDATSDIEISISEVENNTDEENGSKPVKIHIRPSGASKSSVSPAKRMLNSTSTNAETSVEVDLGQKMESSTPAYFAFTVETEEEPITLYADPNLTKVKDPNTEKESDYYTHSVSTSPTTDMEFKLNFKHKDSSCDNKNRELTPLPSDDSGEIALILIHGLQLKKGNCEDFNDFKAIDLNDEDREDTFDQLVTKLTSNNTIDTIDNSYKFYTYRYPTNAPVKEASDELWNLISSNENIEKPVIIAHSMGGVVARKLLLDQGEDKVRALITLGTPHQGTPMANLLTKTSNYLADLKDCPSSQLPVACALPEIANLIEANIGHDTPGTRDLEVNSPIIKELKKNKGNPLKIFTLGGQLGSLSAIFEKNIKYQLGYYYLGVRSLDANDGMVPLTSAVPEWSGLQADLYGHDHTEMVRGEDYEEIEDGSISDHLIPLLQKLIPSSIGENSILVSSGESSTFGGTSAPSDLYAVEISPEGQDSHIGRIETVEGEEIVITDISKTESGELWGISWEDLFRIDSKTGLAVRVGKTGFDQMNALEIDNNGSLLALTGNGSLIDINKNNGSGELISELQDDWDSVGDIAFGPNGNLFAVLGEGIDNNILATIEMDTGKVSPVKTGSEIGFDHVFGITFFKDTLYGVSTTISPDGGALLEIDTSTGTATKIRSLDFQATGAAKQ